MELKKLNFTSVRLIFIIFSNTGCLVLVTFLPLGSANTTNLFADWTLKRPIMQCSDNNYHWPRLSVIILTRIQTSFWETNAVLQELNPVSPDIFVQHPSSTMALVLKSAGCVFTGEEKDCIRQAVNILMVITGTLR